MKKTIIGMSAPVRKQAHLDTRLHPPLLDNL
jgi:hypothetical protein